MMVVAHVCFCLNRPDEDGLQQDKDALLRKLMEAEVDGAAAAQQVSALREYVSKLGGAGRRVSILYICLYKIQSVQETVEK